jgi:hypothetical protein
VPDRITEDLPDQQDGHIPARVPRAENLTDERAGGRARSARPAGKRHALPDRHPGHHRAPGRNILRAAFLDSAVDELFCDAGVPLQNIVSALRASAGPDLDDPQLTDLVGELSLKSADFRRLWARHDVKPHAGTGTHHLQHPQVGELELHYDKFHLAGADRQMLTVYQAQPGSRSEQALSLLATIAADQQHGPVQRTRDIAADTDATS